VDAIRQHAFFSQPAWRQAEMLFYEKYFTMKTK